MSLYLKVWNYFLNIEKRESYFGKMKMKSTQGDQISDAKICHYSVRSLMIRTKYVPIRILDMNYRLIYITYYDWLVLAFDKDFIYMKAVTFNIICVFNLFGEKRVLNLYLSFLAL
jgi:hypothetical protein